jgi:hypothetical protein
MAYNWSCYNSLNKSWIGSVNAFLIHLAVRWVVDLAPTNDEWWLGSLGFLTAHTLDLRRFQSRFGSVDHD